MRITNNIILHNTTGNINGNKVNVNNLNNQMTSQKKIQRPSENPVIAVRSLRLRTTLSEIDQYYENNIPDAESWMKVTETALANMKTILTDIRTQCTYGASDQITADDRKTILTQLEKLRDQVYAEGNADYAGRTVFTGYRTNQKLTFMTDDNTTSYNITQGLSYKNLEEHRYYSDEVTLPTTATEVTGNTISNPKQATFDRIRLSYGEIDSITDKDGNALKETGLVIKPEGSGLYAQDNTGKIALIGVSVEEEDEYGNTVSKIKLTADHIQLEGLVTANGNFKILEDGSIETTNGKFTGEIDSSKGKIGGFEIGNGRIGSVADSHGSGGGLAIYDDFFRVGGSKGYVMFGDDVIPSSAGGAFTAVGRIVNSAPNIYGNYGFDQANYGLFIDVTGGTKNYGISSNAALLAPAFINTKAKLLTFGSGNYTVDFSQHNIILMYYNEPNYSKVEVTLPSESSVAYKFGMSYLPTDFAAIVTFRVRPGSKNIILKGIYNHNEDLQNYEMASGDSVTVLITKADGFRYQILNHSS